MWKILGPSARLAQMALTFFFYQDLLKGPILHNIHISNVFLFLLVLLQLAAFSCLLHFIEGVSKHKHKIGHLCCHNGHSYLPWGW